MRRQVTLKALGPGRGLVVRVLRGLAEVMLLDSAWAGTVFALGLSTADWRWYGACAVGGVALGTGARGT